MAEDKKFFRGRKPVFFAELLAAAVALGGTVYYIVQSNLDACFNIRYLIAMLVGIGAVAVYVAARLEPFLPVAGVSFGIAFGLMLYDMLPSLSDVWNGVNFIGGNLTAYLIYTAVTFIAAIITTITCFTGTEKEAYEKTEIS